MTAGRACRQQPAAVMTLPPGGPTSKRELTPALIAVARLWHFRSAHFRPALTIHGWRTAVGGDGRGWPDVFLVGEGEGPNAHRLVVAEGKGASDRPTAEQLVWLHALADAGIESYIVRPEGLVAWSDVLGRTSAGMPLVARARQGEVVQLGRRRR